MVRSGPDHRAPIDFSSRRQRDFSSVESGFDLSVREELPGRMTRSEGDLNFFPDWVKAIARDSIDHGDKRLASGQAGIRLVDKVEGRVMLKEFLFGSVFPSGKRNNEIQ